MRLYKVGGARQQMDGKGHSKPTCMNLFGSERGLGTLSSLLCRLAFCKRGQSLLPGCLETENQTRRTTQLADGAKMEISVTLSGRL